MGMQLEAGEVGKPDERRRVAGYHLVRAPTRRKAKRHDLDPRRTRGRCALLVEKLATDAVGIAHQHVGPAAGAEQCSLRYAEVVVREVQLGVSRAGKEHLAGIRDGDLTAVDREQLLVAASLP